MPEKRAPEERPFSKETEIILVTRVSISTPEERPFPIASRFLKAAPRVFACAELREEHEAVPRVFACAELREEHEAAPRVF